MEKVCDMKTIDWYPRGGAGGGCSASVEDKKIKEGAESEGVKVED